MGNFASSALEALLSLAHSTVAQNTSQYFGHLLFGIPSPKIHKRHSSKKMNPVSLYVEQAAEPGEADGAGGDGTGASNSTGPVPGSSRANPVLRYNVIKAEKLPADVWQTNVRNMQTWLWYAFFNFFIG
mmetsp:Transcript_16527/g.28081  ORF Transcript_16527/g.28081 Transcript_16527/m.28081 type:complete len:129 (+) Transcript_16527:40-426(+)